ncbi:hypothetical protein [Streptomyces johnsoniae]|uniref:DUF4350 domain-containing protein n=1 Tax=Streptomyces johnsoniae TaxID=3075532 RepID=A0ABU2S227_9ACTN|nr:hypothetical protein [Streptomyces sp. DSM 41886]MDT0442990.1 hypothetical protein [Streptomyces sp. DSM 41886]
MRGAVAALAGLVGSVLLFGLLIAPPAHAAGQLDAAAEALADGPGVWVAEDYEGIDERTVELMRARYAAAETPIRVAMLTEEMGEGDAAAEELAASVGERGVYLVYNEVSSPVSDSPVTARAWAVTGVPVTREDLEAEDAHRIGIPSGNFLLSLPDALDDDLRPSVAAVSDDDPFFVDPAVTAAFPALDVQLLRDSFAEVPRIRAALVSGVGGDLEAAQASMLTDLPDDGVAVLIQWEDDGAFSAVFGAGPDVPYEIYDLETVIGASAITEVPVDQVPQRLALLAALLSPVDPAETARAALADTAVYVHPGISDWRTTPEEVAEHAEELTAADPSARVAFLPEPVLDLRFGDPLPGPESALAELVAADGQNVAVFTVAPYHGGHMSTTSATGEASFVEAAGWAHGSDAFIGETLTDLLGRIESADGFGPSLGALAGVALGPFELLLLLSVAALLARVLGRRLTRRQRRARAAAARRRRLAAMPPARVRSELATAELAARAAAADLIRLGDDLADVPPPASPGDLRALKRLRGEYERLLDAHANVTSRQDVVRLRQDLTRVRRGLDRLPRPVSR